jgi:hypothetical protein
MSQVHVFVMQIRIGKNVISLNSLIEHMKNGKKIILKKKKKCRLK